MHKKILILGDSGRGKSTFAEKLSKKIDIPFYSTDDFFWKIKFTEMRDKQERINEVNKIYDKDQWILEGGTRHLIYRGIELADVIYFLSFSNIFAQYYYLIKRSLGRKHERVIDLFDLLKHVTYKRYKKGYGNHMPSTEELLKSYEGKVIKLTSLKAIDGELNKF
jgi:adenylate kinase family enzyme